MTVMIKARRQQQRMMGLPTIRCFLLVAFLSLKVLSHAQIPSPGIYELREGDNIFDAGYYARYIVNPGSFYKVIISPHKEASAYNVKYALIAIDTVHSNGLMKIALLRDTVSAKGKVLLQEAVVKPPPFYQQKPLLVQDFQIAGDSLTGLIKPGDYIESRMDVKGYWTFRQDQLAISKAPVRKNLSQYDSATHENSYGSIFTFEQGIFYSSNAWKAPYIDLRYTGSIERIPVYITPYPKGVSKTCLSKNEYYAIRRDSADWFFIDRIRVLAGTQRYHTIDGVREQSTQPAIVSGWVKKQDLVANRWVRQLQQSPAFRFEVSDTSASDDGYENAGQLDAVRIINKRTRQVQVILDIGATPDNSINNVVQVQDCNFDGYPDIWINFQNGGAGPNYTRNFYLYNPHNRQFEYSEELSDLPQVEVDSRAKRITSNWRDGAAHHGGEQYTFTHDTLTKTSYWDNYCRNEYFCTYTEGKQVGSNWQEKTHYQGIISDTAVIYPEPNDTAAASGMNVKTDWVDILGETPLWFHIEITDSNGHARKGWTKKTNMLPAVWLNFSAQTAQYSFSAATADSTSLAAVRVTDKRTGEVKQLIPIYTSPEYSDTFFETGDYNNDHLTDFRIATCYEQDQAIYDYYLFDSRNGLFKLLKK